MVYMDYFKREPTARSSWRMAILMGANTRSYKFPLGAALLDRARAAEVDLSIGDLAVPYALEIARHSLVLPQAPADIALSDTDYLTVCAQEAQASVDAGAPTERLLQATVRNIPGMVMEKFHNLRGVGEVPVRMYDITGAGDGARVRLSPGLIDLAQGPDATILEEELRSRWDIVACSYATGIGGVLRQQGLRVDGERLTDPGRRHSVSGLAEAIDGFQYGLCFYCHEPLVSLRGEDTHVDHVFPHSLMRKLDWQFENSLDEVWNLVLACPACNLAKSDRPPTPEEVRSLYERNEAIMQSPHPLRASLTALMRTSAGGPANTAASRRAFLRSVDTYIHEGRV